MPSLVKPEFCLRTLLLIVTAVAVILSLSSALAPVAVWDGRFVLSISVHGRSPDDIVDVSYAAYQRRDLAEWAANDSTPISRGEFKPAALEGMVYVSYIPCYGRRSAFGRELNYGEHRFVVVRITCKSGEVRKIVEVPAGRGPRSVLVSVDDSAPKGSNIPTQGRAK